MTTRVRQWLSGGEPEAVFTACASAFYASEAERCLDDVGTDSDESAYWLARAQVYATLAVAARPVR